jgi:hypothetical protein
MSSAGRVRILLGLRLRLALRAAAGGQGRLVLTLLGWVLLAGVGLSLGIATARLASGEPALQGPLVRGVFLSVFLVQGALGALSVVASEFFDVSRLLHLPVRSREVFTAMTLAGLLSPMILVYAAPLVGLLVVVPGGGADLLFRLASVLLLLLLGHSCALGLNLLLLLAFTRRRIRDLATLAASLVGTGVFLLIRTLEPDRTVEILVSDPARGFAWVPSQWLARVFLEGPEALAPGLLALLVQVAILAAGGRALAAAYLGLAPPSATPARARPDSIPTGGPIAELARATRRIYLREPHIKGLYLQQTVFLLLPILLLEIQGAGRGTGSGVLLVLLPGLLALSHTAFVQSQFGLDGRGLQLLLLSPLPRSRLLLGRGLGLLGIFLVLDSLLATAAWGAVGWIQGIGPELRRLPLVLGAVCILDLVMLAVGAVTSVVMPTRLFTPGRRALAGQRMEGAGCAAQAGRMLIFLPGLLAGSILAGIAVFPALPINRVVPPGAILLSLPLGVLAALLVWLLVLRRLGPTLQRRQDLVMATLIDAGD